MVALKTLAGLILAASLFPANALAQEGSGEPAMQGTEPPQPSAAKTADLPQALKGHPITMTFGSHYNVQDVEIIQGMVKNCKIRPLWKPEYEQGILIESNGEKRGATNRISAAGKAIQMCSGTQTAEIALGE